MKKKKKIKGKFCDGVISLIKRSQRFLLAYGQSKKFFSFNGKTKRNKMCYIPAVKIELCICNIIGKMKRSKCVMHQFKVFESGCERMKPSKLSSTTFLRLQRDAWLVVKTYR